MPAAMLQELLRQLHPATASRCQPAAPRTSASEEAESRRPPERLPRDAHTVALYEFREGEGNNAAEASGDPALALAARQALWSDVRGFGPVARFTRSADDAEVFIGPADNDKLELRQCPDEWTIEAWLRHTGPTQPDGQPFAYVNICGTDEEGFSLPEGVRSGWNFSLHARVDSRGSVRSDGLHDEAGEKEAQFDARLVPSGRNIHTDGATTGNSGLVSEFYVPSGATAAAETLAIDDDEWHHVAWQWRSADQMHSLFIDKQLVWHSRPPVVNAVAPTDIRGRHCCIPFHVGGFIHHKDQPYDARYGNFEGEIAGVMISRVMRYPVLTESDSAFKIVQALGRDYNVRAGDPTAELSVADPAFVVELKRQADEEASLPDASVGVPFSAALAVDGGMAASWAVVNGALLPGLALDGTSGIIHGTPSVDVEVEFTVQATSSCGAKAAQRFSSRAHTANVATNAVVPRDFSGWDLDANTLAQWDWQGPTGRLYPSRTGEAELALAWTNIGGDKRQEVPSAGGKYPFMPGGGEHGYTGPQSPITDLKSCSEEWTVDTWFKLGGHPSDVYGRPYTFGHLVGTYDNTEAGVWELYLSAQGVDGGLAPGVNFASSDHLWSGLGPGTRPAGRTAALESVVVKFEDSDWHHLAWQYSYGDDTHQLFLDGKVVWEMAAPDELRLTNDREHDAQFSVGTRLDGFARYGGKFNWLGFGNFYGHIGEIRISDVRRYG